MALRITDNRDFAAGILYLVVGTGFAIASLDLTIGTPARMGTGFFPFVVAAALAVTGIVVAAGAVHRDAEATDIGPWELRPVLLVCLAVIVFGLLLKPAGLIVTVPAVIGICALAARTFTLRKYVLSVAVLLPLCWAVFVALLGLPIPLLPLAI